MQSAVKVVFERENKLNNTLFEIRINRLKLYKSKDLPNHIN